MCYEELYVWQTNILFSYIILQTQHLEDDVQMDGLAKAYIAIALYTPSLH